MPSLLPDHRTRGTLLHQAANTINAYLEHLAEWPVVPQFNNAELRRFLEAFEFETPQDNRQILAKVCQAMERWGIHTAHPRCFGLFNPTPAFPGVLADLLVAGYNPQAGAWHQNPFAVETERHLIRYFAKRFALGENAYGHFTSGGSEANTTGTLVALTRRFPDFPQHGLRGLKAQPVFYGSAEFHHSFDKIARQCGLGRSALRQIPVTDADVMDVDALAARIRQDRQAGFAPFMVVATAGTTNAGLVEPLTEIAAVAAQEGLHYHVDAAWGGGVILSDALRPLLAGIEAADSITFDPHKLLSVPMGAGMFLCRQHRWLGDTFGVDTDYVPDSDIDGLDNYRQSLQFSRRFIGLKLFMSLAVAGREAYGRQIERQFEQAQKLAEKLRTEGWHVVNGASMGVVCCVLPDLPENADPGTAYEAIASAVRQSGEAWISTTRLGGRPVIRACVTSYLCRENDLDVLVNALSRARRETLG